MDWTLIITGIVAALGGGGITALFTLRANRDKINTETESEAIRALNDAINGLREECNRKDTTIESKENVIASLREDCNRLSNVVTSLQSTMCMHFGCKLRRPIQGQGQQWYEEHREQANLGADYLSVETLLRQWRANQTPGNITEDA